MLRLAAVLAALAACSHAKTTTTAPGGAATFELGEITVYDGEQAVLKIHANGTTEMAGHGGELKVEPGKPASTDSLPIVWKAGPTVKAGGSIEHDGKSLTLDADGRLVASDGHEMPPMTITAEQATMISGFTITLAADGRIGFPGGAPESHIRVEGADTPGKRRLVLTFIALSVGAGAKRHESHERAEPEEERD